MVVVLCFTMEWHIHDDGTAKGQSLHYMYSRCLWCGAWPGFSFNTWDQSAPTILQLKALAHCLSFCSVGQLMEGGYSESVQVMIQSSNATGLGHLG